MNVDRWKAFGRGLQDVAIVMDLHELTPVGGRSPGRRDGRRLERLAEVCETLTSRGRSHPGLCPLANLRFEVSRLLPAVFSEPDVAAAPWALKQKLLPHPRHELGPGKPRRVVRAGLVTRICVAAFFGGMTVAPMPAGRGLLPLADVADRECRDGFSQPVIHREYSVIAMPVLPRRRDEIGEPVEELKRGKCDDAAGSRPRGFTAATPPDPVGGFVPWQHVADLGDAAGRAADHGESLEREGGPGAIPQQVFQTLKIAGHIAVEERDPDEKRLLKTHFSPRRACRRRPRRLS
jgi:hypothetical protein